METIPFDECYIPEPNSGCWLWLQCVVNGYGMKGFRGKNWRAHRISWVLHRGEIPDGLQVLHKCDEPLCVNPDHLWLGTQADNIRDKHEKGREADQRGEANGGRKLTADQVARIRADTRSQSKIARDFNVAQGLISMIKTRRIWNYPEA